MQGMENDVKPIEVEARIFNDMKAALRVAIETRAAQRLYFKTRKQDDLIASKRLETALDVRLATLKAALGL